MRVKVRASVSEIVVRFRVSDFSFWVRFSVRLGVAVGLGWRETGVASDGRMSEMEG